MTQPDESHDQLTVAEFIHEFWILFFFGMFFLMTLFLPLLFMDNHNWLYWGIVVTLGLAMSLLGLSVYWGKQTQRK